MMRPSSGSHSLNFKFFPTQCDKISAKYLDIYLDPTPTRRSFFHLIQNKKLSNIMNTESISSKHDYALVDKGHRMAVPLCRGRRKTFYDRPLLSDGIKYPQIVKTSRAEQLSQNISIYNLS